MPLHFPVLARVAVLALGVVGGVGAVAGSASCTTDTTVVGVTPVTGVLVRSNALVTGIGCGTGDAQIFEYVAVVTSQDGSSAWAGAYPCYSDATFVNLPFADAGQPTIFDVAIFAYSKAAFDQAAAHQLPLEATAQVIGGPLTDATRATIASLEAVSTWTTDCSATQQPNVEVLADCQPLVARAAP